ncbi:hypothetical protein K1T71_001052 [Dendrolimus kikuchii]|uniref:Uncharacterized protein n=1 Tax=Dendrolimus kikuchii TaxID=765133 RepID=A0ACC1DI71_9NEOP|nr:hypothetical protein K1T71_001052 [Dendrolimus kikuchii]
MKNEDVNCKQSTLESSRDLMSPPRSRGKLLVNLAKSSTKEVFNENDEPAGANKLQDIPALDRSTDLDLQNSVGLHKTRLKKIINEPLEILADTNYENSTNAIDDKNLNENISSPIEESHPRPTIDEEHVEATVNVINSTNKNNCINTEDPDYIPEINDDDSEQP